jgi:hypothetical protein
VPAIPTTSVWRGRQRASTCGRVVTAHAVVPIRLAGSVGGHAAALDVPEEARRRGVARLVFTHIGRPTIRATDAGERLPFGELGVDGAPLPPVTCGDVAETPVLGYITVGQNTEVTMYVFAILMLFGLGVAASVVFLDRFFARFLMREMWALVAVAAGIALAWLADFDMWAQWGVPVRESWIGVTLTGLALGGVAYFFHELLGFFTGLHRKYEDEAKVIEHTELHRAA